MLDSGVPPKFATPFANSASSGNITYPIPATPSTTPGTASLSVGLSPLNFINRLVGGIPPFGSDFNGILKQITAWLQWVQAGAPIVYDATFQGQIGGYPNGAMVVSGATAGLYWLSTTDNNTSDPDTGGSNWIPLATKPTERVIASGGTSNLLVTDTVVILQLGSPASAQFNLPTPTFCQNLLIIADYGTSPTYGLAVYGVINGSTQTFPLIAPGQTQSFRYSVAQSSWRLV